MHVANLKIYILILYYNNYIISLFTFWQFLGSRHLSWSVAEIFFIAGWESLQDVRALWDFIHKKDKLHSWPLKQVHKLVVRISKVTRDWTRHGQTWSQYSTVIMASLSFSNTCMAKTFWLVYESFGLKKLHVYLRAAKNP